MKEIKKKYILIFIQSGVGGAERMSVLIGKMLDLSLFTIKFIVVSRDGLAPIECFIPAVYDRLVIKYNNPVSAIISFCGIIKRERPDIVFSSVLFLNDKLLLLRPLFRKILFVVRCENYFYTFSRQQKIIIKYLYRLANAIIVQTKEMKDELVNAEIDEKKVVVLSNPVDAKLINEKIEGSSSPYPQNGKKHFVASGRFAYQKGFDMLVNAFAEVLKVRDDVDLFILGANDGDYELEYKRVWKIVSDAKLENVIHCVGFQKNPYTYIRYADCFVLSSRWEGLPNVLIEALYLGTPVAAFKCVPVVERIVKDRVNGYLADKNDVNSLKNAMCAAVNLGRVECNYKGADGESFRELFVNFECD